MYAIETHADEKKLRTFENKVLRKTYGPIYVGYWRRSYNTELDNLFQEQDIVKPINISRLRWLGHLRRMTNNPLARRKNRGRRRVGRPCLLWMGGLTEDLHRMRISNWLEIDGHGEIYYGKPGLTKSCSADDDDDMYVIRLPVWCNDDFFRWLTQMRSIYFKELYTGCFMLYGNCLRRGFSRFLLSKSSCHRGPSL